jgi:hypothetical protein
MKAGWNENKKQRASRRLPILSSRLGRLGFVVSAIALSSQIPLVLSMSESTLIFIASITAGLIATILSLTKSQIIRRAPCSSHLQLAEFFFSKRKYEKVYLPIIQDMREEYFETLSQNRIWKARWVRARGTWSFFAAIGLDRLFSIVSLCVKVWKSVN